MSEQPAHPADAAVSGNLPVLPTKKKGAPITRTPKQQAAAVKQAQARDLAVQESKAKADAATLAQAVNLVIAGHSFEDIGASIGATAAEVEKMITTGAERYVRTQPALRAWVRNWISGKFTTMIEADWDQASDPHHPEKLEHQDRVMRMLPHLARLHGAEAPSQAEVKVEHSSEAVERLVQTIAAREGKGYDTSIFDGADDEDDENTVDAVLVHDAAAGSLAAIEAASREVEMPQPEDGEGDLRA